MATYVLVSAKNNCIKLEGIYHVLELPSNEKVSTLQAFYGKGNVPY